MLRVTSEFWKDPLDIGPVPGGVSSAKLIAIRARVHADAGWGEFETVAREMAARDTQVVAADEVELAFDADLRSQLQMLHCLHVRGERPARIATEARTLAKRAWAAFTAPDMEAIRDLAAQDTSALPDLHAALARLLEEELDECTGLWRSEAEVLRAVQAGDPISEPVQAWTLGQLRRHPYPLIHSDPPELMLLGRAVLAGQANALDYRVLDRWIGGTHLHREPQQPHTLEEQLEKMRRDWDIRARANARHFIATESVDWHDEDFFAYGERTVAEYITNDLFNICQGRDPKQMRIIEIGCGAGRVTRALAQIFGEVHAVDISGEMIAKAREALHDCGNALLYQNNGMDLSVLPPGPYDFAFSSIVFQHIPSREVIRSYVQDVHRLLRPGALFKFQVQGDTKLESFPANTWVGVAWTDEEVVQLAEACGFEPRYRHGASGQYFWLWFFSR